MAQVTNTRRFLSEHPLVENAVFAVLIVLLFTVPLLGLWVPWLTIAGLVALPLALNARMVAGWRSLLVFAVCIAASLAVVRSDATLVTALCVLLLLIAGRLAGTYTATSASAGTRILESPTMMIHADATIDGMVRAAEAIGSVVEQQVIGASDQATVIQMTNAQLDEFLLLSERVGEQTRAMTRTAQEASEISVLGQESLSQAISAINQLREQVQAVAHAILRLTQLTRRIDTIITSVSEIATQSNMLALNASIEAARAGGQGRGFAVVAEEVRSLSQQSTDAARQVRAILGEIQVAVRETIDATEIGMQAADTGVGVTREANRVMSQLAVNVTASYEAIRAISEVIRQQADGMETITINLERVDRITQQNVVSIHLIESVSKSLMVLAQDLRKAGDSLSELSPIGASLPMHRESNRPESW